MIPACTLPTASSLGNGVIEGELRRDRAHAHLRRRRPELIRRVQRAFVTHLLRHGPSTIDPIRVRVPLPVGTDPRLVGAAVRALAEDRIIESIGIEKSTRPAAHARKVERWALRDDDAAIAWLAANPELSEPDEPTRCN